MHDWLYVWMCTNTEVCALRIIKRGLGHEVPVRDGALDAVGSQGGELRLMLRCERCHGEQEVIKHNDNTNGKNTIFKK